MTELEQIKGLLAFNEWNLRLSQVNEIIDAFNAWQGNEKLSGLPGLAKALDGLMEMRTVIAANRAGVEVFAPKKKAEKK